MLKFHKCKLNDSLLDQWISADVNVLLIGEKGVGKSAQILNAFDRNNLKYAYFSGATLDPWIHLLGIPKAKVQEDGTEKMEFILPENLDNDVQAIFCDEWNRTNKVVRNALLELQQFKSINGRKFPNLKIVWGAVNPPKDENEADSLDYDVDELDPAQLDRFHIIVELPNEPDLKYFKSQFGEYHGKVLVDWWKEQSKESKKILSPRRLDYIGQSFRKGLDVKFLLPVSANPVDLIKKLSSDETEEMIKRMFENPNDDDMIDFIKNDKNFLKYKSKLKEPRYWKYWKHAKKEFVADEIKTNENFSNYTIYQVCKNEKYYIDQVLEIASSNPNMEMIKLIKVLKEQKYIPPKEESISSFIGNAAPFPTIDILSGYGSGVDNFSNVYPISSFININTYSTTTNINMNTQERRKLIDILGKCIHVIKNKRQVITFVISCLSSMQKGTISSTKQFLPIFGTACVMAKETLSKSELQTFIQDISKYKDKLSINRIEDFTEFLLGKSSQNNQTPVPEEFLKKLKDIRAMISVFSSDNTLKQII